MPMVSAGKVACQLHAFALSSDWFIRLNSPIYDNCGHLPESNEKRCRVTNSLSLHWISLLCLVLSMLKKPSWFMMSSYRFKVLQFISQMFNSSFNVNQSFVSSVLTVLWISTAINETITYNYITKSNSIIGSTHNTANVKKQCHHK